MLEDLTQIGKPNKIQYYQQSEQIVKNNII